MARIGAHCCAPTAVLAWVDDLITLALEGDPDARRCLPIAIDHWLKVTHVIAT